MNWGDDGIATKEYGWLRLMSSVKYDGYSDFKVGVRFLESLATWLGQFDEADRKTAYNFVRERLVYISPAELNRVIEAFVPETVTPHIRRLAAEETGVKPYEVWGNKNSARVFKDTLRRSLFVGLSDGSRIDILRRANAVTLTTEQVVPMMNIGIQKWDDLADNLNEEQDGAKFEDVYLIDDFTASGTTFIRFVDGQWKGKLKKFNDMILSMQKGQGDKFPIANNYRLHIHHYISTYQARQALEERVQKAEQEWAEKSYGEVSITEGLLLPENLKLTDTDDQGILELCDKYYDHHLYLRLKKHCDQAGQTNMKRGYAECALPLILDHNTPNNSISLLWAETDGIEGNSMRPLFRRQDRHG